MTKIVTFFRFLTKSRAAQARVLHFQSSLLLLGVFFSAHCYSFSGKIVAIEKCIFPLNSFASPHCQELAVPENHNCSVAILDTSDLQKNTGKSFQAHFSLPDKKIKNKKFTGHVNFFKGDSISGLVVKDHVNKKFRDQKLSEKYVGYVSAWKGFRDQKNQNFSVDLDKVIFTLEKIESADSTPNRTFIDYICQLQK